MVARMQGISRARTVRTVASSSAKSRFARFSMASGVVRWEMPTATTSGERFSTSPPSRE